MKINKFWIDNFRAYKGHYDVPITDEILNLITAQNNGAGKTTLFFAFYYLVTGYVTGKSQDDYINWDCDNMSCGIDFTYDNKNFTIECSLKREKTPEKKLTIESNGQIEEVEGVSNVNKKLKEYFEPSLFLNSTAMFQGSKNFTSIKDSERRDNLKKVFNIDYSQELKSLDIEQKDNDLKIISCEKDLAVLKSKTFKIDNFETFGEVNELNVDSYKKEIDDLTRQLEDIKIKIAMVDSNNKKFNDLKKDITDFEATIEKDRKDIDYLKTRVEAYKNYQEDTSKIDTLQNELDSLCLERLKPFDKNILITHRDNLSTAKADLALLEKNKKDCSNGICPVCGKSFDSTDIEHIDSEINEKKVIINSELSTISELENKEDDYDKKVLKNNEITKKQSDIFSKIEIEKLKIKHEKETNDTNLNQASKSIEEKENDIVSIQKRLDEKEKELEKLTVLNSDNLEEEKSVISNTVCAKKNLVKEYDDKVLKNSIIEKNNNKKIEEEKTTKKDIEDKQKEYDDFVLQKSQISKMKVFLKNEFPSYVISTMITRIQDSMNDFISKVYYKDLDVEIKGTDDNISVKYGTGAVKIDAVNASGAEEALLALSYCHALNELKHYDILFMDEVDQAFTEDNSQKLAEIVIGIKNTFDNIFTVSHVRNTKDYYAINGANIINIEKNT